MSVVSTLYKKSSDDINKRDIIEKLLHCFSERFIHFSDSYHTILQSDILY